MMRTIILAAVLVLAAVPAAAQQSAPPIQLTLDPMTAPVPALKYYLVPQLRDRHTGNAALLYYRSFSPEWQTHRRDHKYMEKVAAANEKLLRDLTRAEVDSLVGGFTPGILKEVDRGARRTYCDWELNQRVKEDGIGLLLPDLQGLRELAGLLKLRARKELLAGQYNQAARTLQTGMQLGRHAAEGPTLIHGLVGVRVVETMLTVVDDWVERPGAPNLYWALTDLPRPLVSMRNGLEGERLFMDWLFPGYRELLEDPNAPPSSARVQTSLHKYAGVLGAEGADATLGSLLIALKTYPYAKRFLRQKGRGAEEVEAMPALQAVFLFEIHQYDVVYDDMRKWVNLPYAEALPHLHQINVRLKMARAKMESGWTLAGMILPAIENVLAAPVRVERKIAALRCVEALRLHAAAHGGKLPAKLDEVTEVPIPLDPRTGKLFEYRLEGNKATLTGPTPADEKPNKSNSIRYELTMRTPRGNKETGRQGDKETARPAGRKRPAYTSPSPVNRAAWSDFASVQPRVRGLEGCRPAVYGRPVAPGLFVSLSGPGAEDAKFDPGERARVLATLIEADTFALVRIDFTRTDLQGLSKILPVLFPSRNDNVEAMVGWMKKNHAAFTKAGGTELVVSLSTDDIPAISFVYVPLKDGADMAELTRLLETHLIPGTDVERRGSALVAGSNEALSRFARGKPSKRPELTAAVTAAGDTAIQVLLLPTADQRRVIDEMVSLPLPGASGKALTRGVRWAALGIDLGARPRVELTLQSADASAAKTLTDLIAIGVDLVGRIKLFGEDKPLKELLAKEFAAAASALKWKVSGSRVIMQLTEPDSVRALSVFVDTISARTAGVERQSMNFRDILIALHNYNSAIGALPPHAIYSKAGKPLLSWRVTLLPYLGQAELYKQFKLDEPWDSPRNKKLIDRMPKVYRSPKIKDPRPGLTTYLVPLNKDFVFTGTKEGTQLKDITDGTSNTAMVVDVSDEAGVIWTKPEDLVVDKKDSWKGLIGHYPSFVLVGMADGSTLLIPKTVNSAGLWAAFTRAGGEVLPDLRN